MWPESKDGEPVWFVSEILRTGLRGFELYWIGLVVWLIE